MLRYQNVETIADDVEKDGVWCYLEGDDTETSAIRVRRWGNADFMRLHRSKHKGKGILKKLERNELGWEVTEKAMVDVVARTIMNGWKGDWFCSEETGKPVEMTVEFAKELLRSAPRIRAEIEEFAQNDDNYFLGDIKAAAGKSTAPSGGSVDSTPISSDELQKIS